MLRARSRKPVSATDIRFSKFMNILVVSGFYCNRCPLSLVATIFEAETKQYTPRSESNRNQRIDYLQNKPQCNALGVFILGSHNHEQYETE